MKTNFFAFVTTLAMWAGCFCLNSAQAQATRTWVSGVGDDLNPASRTAPAKTFAGAQGKTAIGGEVDVLDPGDFGSFTVTNSLTIDGKGPLAGASSTAGVAVIINANGTNIVTLRNLSIRCGTYGVRITGAGAGVVRLENCVIIGGNTNAIDFQPTTANAKLYLLNCHIYGAKGNGLFASPATGGMVVMKNSIIEECGAGINAAGGTVILFDSSVTGNTGAGLATSGSGAIKTFHNNLISGNNPDGNPTGSLPLR